MTDRRTVFSVIAAAVAGLAAVGQRLTSRKTPVFGPVGDPPCKLLKYGWLVPPENAEEVRNLFSRIKSDNLYRDPGSNEVCFEQANGEHHVYFVGSVTPEGREQLKELLGLVEPNITTEVKNG